MDGGSDVRALKRTFELWALATVVAEHLSSTSKEGDVLLSHVVLCFVLR